MARYVAVLPASIRRRWDRIARDQLCLEALRLIEENEALRDRAEWAESSAQMWQDIAERERGGEQTIGLTEDGHVVVITEEMHS